MNVRRVLALCLGVVAIKPRYIRWGANFGSNRVDPAAFKVIVHAPGQGHSRCRDHQQDCQGNNDFVRPPHSISLHPKCIVFRYIAICSDQRHIWNSSGTHNRDALGTHLNNLAHTCSPGCFRCHHGKHVNAVAEVIPNNCNTCYTVVSRTKAGGSWQVFRGYHAVPMPSFLLRKWNAC